jgi:hypothetical protein
MNERMTIISPTDVVGRAFAIYKEHAAALIAAALAVFAVTAVVSLIFDSGLLVLIPSIVGLVAHTFYQGVVVRLVDDTRDGVLDASVGDLFKSVVPVVVPLLLAGILLAIAIGIGLLLLIVPGLCLMTIWAVTAPVIVLERRGVFEALGRSRELVRGNGWSVFGVIVIVFVLEFGVGLVAGTTSALGGHVVGVLVQLVATVLVAPIAALAVSVLYFVLRDAGGAPVAPAEPVAPTI